MPIHFERGTRPTVRVPLCETTFVLGADLACHLVVDAPGVAGEHARVGFVHGEFVLTSVGPAPLWVNGTRTPLIALRDGDRVDLAAPGEPGAVPLVFRNLLQGAFLPPGTPRVTAAMGLGIRRPPSDGGGCAARDGPQTAPCGTPVRLKRLPPLREDQDPDAWYRVLTALAGAPHPNVALVVDGGYAPAPDGSAERWILTRDVPGTDLRARLAGVGLKAAEGLGVLAGLARAVAHLHARGLVHGDVSPGNVIVAPDGQPTLIDFGAARPWRERGGESRGVVGTPGYVAPEEVLGRPERGRPPADVYALGAVGYALVAGAPPAAAEDLLGSLGAALTPPPPLRARGFEVPESVETLLLEALDPDPTRRPAAAALARGVEEVRRGRRGGAAHR